MNYRQATSKAMVSFLLTIFFLKIRVIHSVQHVKDHRNVDQMISDEKNDRSISPSTSVKSDIFIVYNSKQFGNNSIIRVPEGETVTLTCVKGDDKRKENENNEMSSSSQKNFQQSSVWDQNKNIVHSDAQYYGWYSDGVLISNTQTLSLPNVYADTLPSQLSCAIHGHPLHLNQVIRDKNENQKNRHDESDISITKRNIVKELNIKIEILTPPSFTIRRIPAFGIPIVEGMTVKLSCDIEFGHSNIPNSSKQDKKLIPKWMKNEVPVDENDYEGRFRESGGSVTIMQMGMSDVGWYQCYTKVDGESYSSIGYFLNVKPDDDFETKIDTSEDSTKEVKELPLNSDDRNSESGDASLNIPLATTSTERIHFQMVGDNVVYEESSGDSHFSNILRERNCTCCEDTSIRKNKKDIHRSSHNSDSKSSRGGGHHPRKHPLYTGPLVRSMNHSKLFVNIGDNVSIEIEVCSNPRAHRIIWIAPNFRSIKISGREKDVNVDNLIAKRVTESKVRVTCVQAMLVIKRFSWDDEGEYSLIAKNRYGFDGDSIVIKMARGTSRRRQRSKEKDRTNSHDRNLEQMKLPQINGSICMKFECHSISLMVLLSVSFHHINRYLNSQLPS